MGTASPLPHLHPGHPLGPPAWRWLRAPCLVQKGKKLSQKKDDAGIKDAIRFFRASRRADGSAQRKQGRRAPALFTVQQVYVSNSFQRCQLEAHLLTDEPFDVVGATSFLAAAEVASIYETYCCFSYRLQATRFTNEMVIGHDGLVGLKQDDVAANLRLFAFFRGTVFPDHRINCYLRTPAMPGRPGPLPVALERLRTRLLIAATALTHTLSVSRLLLKKLAITTDAFDAIQRGLGPVNRLRRGQHLGDAGPPAP
jgi:hypothetical protein